MFTYIDPDVRRRLVDRGRLRRIDKDGQPLDVDAPPVPGRLSINLLGPIPLPVNVNGWRETFDWYAAVRNTELSRVESLASALRKEGGQHLFAELASSMAVNSVLIHGDPSAGERPLVRVHSNCLTGDVFGSERCECGPQLEAAMRQIAGHPDGGILIYMAGHEGRGIGLWAKAATYLLQDDGEDTYQANRSLGLPDDSRDFSDAAALLKYFLGPKPFDLLTNNPKKVADLHAAGLTQAKSVKHVTGVSEWNRRYLEAKAEKGHQIEPEDLNQDD
ncbi:MAG: GTP cyclohydrolase II [Pseudomonadota bacterium]